MRVLPHLGIVIALLAGCAQPAQVASSSASSPTTSAPTAAGTSGGSSSRAKTCSVTGFRWNGTEPQISPTMTVSSDGYCGQTPNLTGTSTQKMEATAQPQHGRLVTTGDNSMSPNFRYYPQAGYSGPDSFTVLVGRSNRPVSAVFAVTVLP